MNKDENPSKINPSLSKINEQNVKFPQTFLLVLNEPPAQDTRQTPPLNNGMYDEFLKVQEQASISEMIMVNKFEAHFHHTNLPSFPGDSMEYLRFTKLLQGGIS